MTSRRDWQLQQLGITQWSLRRPGALQGEIAISLPEHIRLVMVAETPPSLTEPLIGDILRALAVTPDQVLQLTPERVAMLPQDSRCNSWRLGTEASLPLAGAQVSTPAFDELQTSTPARRGSRAKSLPRRSRQWSERRAPDYGHRCRALANGTPRPADAAANGGR